MIGIDLTKTVEKMTNDELESLSKLAELMKDAERERERRRMERDPNRCAPKFEPMRSTITTRACCPSCGRNDAVSMTKTLYATPELAHGGEPIGAALCKCGGGWYDAGSGEHVNYSAMYSY